MVLPVTARRRSVCLLSPLLSLPFTLIGTDRYTKAYISILAIPVFPLYHKDITSFKTQKKKKKKRFTFSFFPDIYSLKKSTDPIKLSR